MLMITLKEAKLKGNLLPESGQYKSWTVNAKIFARNVGYKPELMYSGTKLKAKYAELKRRYKLRKIWNSASGINNSTGEIDPNVRDALYGQHPGLEAEMENPDGFPLFDEVHSIECKGSTPTYVNQEDWSKVAAGLLAAHEARKKKKKRSKKAAPSPVEYAAAQSAVSKLEAIRDSRYAGKEWHWVPSAHPEKQGAGAMEGAYRSAAATRGWHEQDD
jgi:hypothetical protein